jgi:hypothetical protein
MALWIVVGVGFLLLREVGEGRMIQIRSDCQRSNPTWAFSKKYNRLINVMSFLSPSTIYIPKKCPIIHFCVVGSLVVQMSLREELFNRDLVVIESRDK